MWRGTGSNHSRCKEGHGGVSTAGEGKGVWAGMGGKQSGHKVGHVGGMGGKQSGHKGRCVGRHGE